MSVLLTIHIHERGSVRDVMIYNASTYFIGAEFLDSNTDLTIYFVNFEPIVITFPSVTHRETFLTDLRDGIDAADDFELSNIGPIATTTTTTTTAT